MNEMNRDDVKMMPSIEHNDDDDDDDDHSFDGMDIEDWLIKQQQQVNYAPDGCCRQHGLYTQEATVPCESFVGDPLATEATVPCEIFVDDPLATEWKGSTSNSGTLTDTETLDPTVIIDAEANPLSSYANFFVVEVSPTNNHGILVIEGVKTMDPKKRKILMIMGIFVLAAVMATGAGFITAQFTSSSAQEVFSSPRGGDENTTKTLISTPIKSGGGNLSLTLGDVWSIFSPAGGGIENFVVENGALHLFKKLLSRTDKNFTLLSIDKKAMALGGLDISIIAKGLSSMYNGHVLSGMEGLVVDDMVVYEDMYDGMILQSVAGYPLLIQLDPFRINNNTMIPTELNLFFKNGVAHTSYQYPKPLTPWVAKSVYEVLVETNDSRNRDLSAFLAMIESHPELKGELLKERALEGLTVFVPTNDAMATIPSNLTATTNDPTTFLLNHFVSGNFVRRCWQIIPTGTHVSDTELTLETQAGQMLSLEINDDVVIINKNITIIQEDVLSMEGVIQVIDKPLLIFEKNVFNMNP